MTKTTEWPELYPEPALSNSGHLDVGSGHQIYYEVRGDTSKIPVVILHGGPGGGISDSKPSLLDPTKYYAVSFDQRGCGRSTPYGETNNNTTPDLIDDIERLRQHLGIDQWIVFGSSWGAFLGLNYLNQYPDQVTALVANGIYLGRDHETADMFYPGGVVEQIYPEAYETFISLFSQDERKDVTTALYKKVYSSDKEVALTYAKAITKLNGHVVQLIPDPQITEGEMAPEMLDNLVDEVRLQMHYYAAGNCFMDGDKLLDEIGSNVPKRIPVHLIHGRYDMICPMRTAWQVHNAIPHSQLHVIPDGGHRTQEPGTVTRLLEIFDNLLD